jgi:hypothetical protein
VWLSLSLLGLIGVGVGIARTTVSAARPTHRLIAGHTPADSPALTPPVFVTADSGAGGRYAIDLRSPRTGQVLRRLASLPGSDFTNNGLALSPDGRSVYFTLIPRGHVTPEESRNVKLDEVSAGTPTVTQIGYGDEPAVSPDGRAVAYLADLSHGPEVIVDSVSSGQRSSVGVGRLIGTQGSLLNGDTAWLADDQTVVVLPGAIFEADSSAGARATGGPSAKPQLITATRGGDGHLEARALPVSGLSASPLSIFTDADRSRTVLAEVLVRGAAALESIRLGNATATASRLLTIPQGLILTLDPTGTRILYLQGHSPPALWEATIAGDRLIDRKRLFRRSPVGSTAW